jgi:hypothetical protein
MRCAALLICVLGGCFANPIVEIDHDAVALARGTSREVLVTVDGAPELDYVTWAIDDESIAAVIPSIDGMHVRIGGMREGDTVVHLGTHGVIFDVPTHVGPPAIVKIWIEPGAVEAMVGELVDVRARVLDTALRVRDITRESTWAVRDERVATLDMAGMLLEAMDVGETALHVTYGDHATLAPVTIFK